MSVITLAIQPFLDEPALLNDEPALPKASNLPIRLAIALAQAQEWQKAERVARAIEDKANRAAALRELASALTQAGEREQAQPLWQEAERVARAIKEDGSRARTLEVVTIFFLEELATALVQAQEWQEAERVILSTPPRSSPLPRKEPSTASLDWGDLVSKVFDKIAGVASIIALLDAVERRWRERSTTNDAHPHQVASQSSETDIVAIRLRMTHGPDHQFEEWLTDPDKLKHYIDVFNQPSSTILPLKVVFVQRNGKELPVDVLKGTQNNPQLDELLSYLNTNSEQK